MTWTEKMPSERTVLKMLDDIQMAMEEPIISSTIDISSPNSKQSLFEVKGEFHSMNKSEVDEFVSELFDLSLHGYSIKSVKVCVYSYYLMMRVHVKKYGGSKSNITGKVMDKLLKIMTSDLDSDEEL